MEYLHQLEMNLIYAVQEFRSVGLDFFFRLLDYLDGPLFPLIVIFFAWYVLSVNWGKKVFYLYTLISFGCYILKFSFEQPRPFNLDPLVGILHVNFYGFPSGAAMTSVAFFLLMITSWKSNKAWIIGLPYLILVCFSRVYLGVHFPTDILGGLFFGTLIFFAFQSLYPYLEKWIVNLNSLNQLLITLTVPAFLFFCFPHLYVLRLAASVVGVGVGTILKNIYQINEVNYARCLLNAYLIAGFALNSSILFLGIIEYTYYGNLYFKTGVQYLSLGLWVSLGVPFLVNKKLVEPTIGGEN